MAIAITRQDESAAELRRLARASRDVAQARRLLAIALVMEGRSRTEAATAAGMDRQSLRDGVHRFTGWNCCGRHSALHRSGLCGSSAGTMSAHGS